MTDRERLIKIIKSTIAAYCSATEIIRDVIERFAAADVAPVKYGGMDI